MTSAEHYNQEQVDQLAERWLATANERLSGGSPE